MKIFIKWIVGLILIVFGFFTIKLAVNDVTIEKQLVTKLLNYLAGILFLIAGVFIIPTFFKLINKDGKVSRKLKLRVIIISFLSAILCMVLAFFSAIYFGVKESVDAYDKSKEKQLAVANNLVKCAKEVDFDNTKFCFPKVEGFVECKDDNKTKEFIEKLNYRSEILAYYISKQNYQNFTPQYANSNAISFFAQRKTIGVKANEEILDVVFNGMKSAYKGINKDSYKDIQDLINTKSKLKIEKPILLKSFPLGDKVKTCVILTSYTDNKSYSVSKITFNNIVLHKERIYFLNYIKKINDDFKYTSAFNENQNVVDKIINSI